jgi:hypothetical protein
MHGGGEERVIYVRKQGVQTSNYRDCRAKVPVHIQSCTVLCDICLLDRSLVRCCFVL